MNNLKLMYNKEFYANNILNILIDENNRINSNCLKEYNDLSKIDSDLVSIEKNIRE